MSRINSDLEMIGSKIRKAFSAKHEARDTAIKLSREAIYKCSTSIRAAHRGEYNTAGTLAGEARAIIDEVGAAIANQPDLQYTGFVNDSHKEYAEARITLALVSGGELPAPETIDVAYAPYLNGLAEAAGEMRRHILDEMRKGNLSSCETILEMMDDIYSLLVTIDFPDAMTGGLRRTTDMVRGVLERSRGDLTVALRQRDLELKLEAFNSNLQGR